MNNPHQSAAALVEEAMVDVLGEDSNLPIMSNLVRSTNYILEAHRPKALDSLKVFHFILLIVLYCYLLPYHFTSISSTTIDVNHSVDYRHDIINDNTLFLFSLSIF